jgi:hypothetical protein
MCTHNANAQTLQTFHYPVCSNSVHVTEQTRIDAAAYIAALVDTVPCSDLNLFLSLEDGGEDVYFKLA